MDPQEFMLSYIHDPQGPMPPELAQAREDAYAAVLEDLDPGSISGEYVG